MIEDASFTRLDPSFVELLYLPALKILLSPVKLVCSNIFQQQGPTTSKEVNLSSNDTDDKSDTFVLSGLANVMLWPLRYVLANKMMLQLAANKSISVVVWIGTLSNTADGKSRASRIAIPLSQDGYRTEGKLVVVGSVNGTTVVV